MRNNSNRTLLGGGSTSSLEDVDSLAEPHFDGIIFRHKRRKLDDDRYVTSPMDEDLSPLDNAQLQRTVLGLCHQLTTALLKMDVQEHAQMQPQESPKIDLGKVPTVESLLCLFF